MSTETVALGFNDLIVPAGAHIGYPYHNEHDRYENLIGFAVTGLQNGEKCVAAISEYSPDFWLEGLRSRGVEPASLPKGQLEIITAGDYGGSSPVESARNAIHMIGNSLASAHNQGWTGVRACTGYMHLYQHEQAFSELLAAEQTTNEMLHDGNTMVLCTFSKPLLHPNLLDVALNHHPLITDGGSLRTNGGYTPPSQTADRLPEIMRKLSESGAFATPCARLDFQGNVPVVCAGAELDFYTSPKLEELAATVISISHRKVVIDLSATTYLDASTVGILLKLARALHIKGGQLSIYDPVDPIRKIFRLINLDTYIPIHRSLDSALQVDQMSQAA